MENIWFWPRLHVQHRPFKVESWNFCRSWIQRFMDIEARTRSWRGIEESWINPFIPECLLVWLISNQWRGWGLNFQNIWELRNVNVFKFETWHNHFQILVWKFLSYPGVWICGCPHTSLIILIDMGHHHEYFNRLSLCLDLYPRQGSEIFILV